MGTGSLRRRAAAGVALVLLVTGCGVTATPVRTTAVRPDTPTASAPGGSPTAPRATADTSSAAAPAAPAAPATSPAAEPQPSASASGSAAAALAGLTVKGRAPKTGYTRSAFGQAWADVDRNGCDTRNDILRRDLTDVVIRSGTHGCLVESGILRDRYSATSLSFSRGDGRVEIDHVVALSDAWQKGAQQWTLQRRTEFANDPLNLVATRSDLNQQKGDGDAATWLPPARSARCAYVARQVAVKRTYGLWVTTAERDAMQRVLSACPGQTLPTGTDAPQGSYAPVTSPTSAPATRAPATSAPKPLTGTTGTTYYANCTAARAAGVAPLHRGDPGYRAGLDRDGDGVACE